MVPAVTDDAVLGRRLAGQIGGLSRTRHRGKGRRDSRQPAAFDEFREMRRVFADEGLGESDDIDDRGAIHSKVTGTAGIPAGKLCAARRQDAGAPNAASCRGPDNLLLPMAMSLLQLVNRADDAGQIHFMNFKATSDRLQKGNGEFTAEML